MGKTDQTDGGDEEVAEIETFVGAVRLLDDLVVKVIQYHWDVWNTKHYDYYKS